MGVAYNAGELPLAIDPAAGDEAFLTHNGGKVSAEGVTYQALDAIAYLAPFSINDGDQVTATGTFQAVAQDRTRTVDWRTTAYASMLTGAVPGGTTTFVSSFLGIVEVDPRTFYSVPVLYSVVAPAGTPTADLTATVSYGNPFPAAWEEQFQMSINGYRSQTLDGRTGTTVATAGFNAKAEVLSGPIEPGIGPVQNVRVAGRSNTGDLNGVGTRPTITWDPPALGTANSYSVAVVRWIPSGTTRWTR